MRAILALGLAWSILVCATPGLAERFSATPQPAVADRDAGQDDVATTPLPETRVLPASDLRGGCRPVDARQAAVTGSVIPAVYEPATDRSVQRTMAASQVDINSTGLCR